MTAKLADSRKCLHAASAEVCYLLIVEDQTSVMTSGRPSVCAKLSTGIHCKYLHQHHMGYNSENVHLHQTRRTLECTGLQYKKVTADMMTKRALGLARLLHSIVVV